jgi:hypothetical protein
MSDRAKELAVKLRLIGFPVEESLRRYFEPDEFTRCE